MAVGLSGACTDAWKQPVESRVRGGGESLVGPDAPVNIHIMHDC